MKGPAMQFLPSHDPEVARIIRQEESRIENTLDLIAAENHAPWSIFEAQGSIFSTKAAEGYPGSRFHAGCTNADELESLAIARAKRLFGAEHANLQPHSGVSANLAVYFIREFCQISGEFRSYCFALCFSPVNSFERIKITGLQSREISIKCWYVYPPLFFIYYILSYTKI